MTLWALWLCMLSEPMPENPYQTPKETPGMEAYYDAALVGIILVCDGCDAVLDPDTDLV